MESKSVVRNEVRVSSGEVTSMGGGSMGSEERRGMVEYEGMSWADVVKHDLKTAGYAMMDLGSH